MPRYSKAQTTDELKTYIETLFEKNREYINDVSLTDDGEASFEEKLTDLFVSADECIGMSQVVKDLLQNEWLEHYHFPTEEELDVNPVHPEDWHYLKVTCGGFQSMEGRTFFGAFGGTSHAESVFFAVYQDDKNRLRAYKPKKGNGLNPLSKASFGVNKEKDDAFAKSKGYGDFLDMKKQNPAFIAELYDTETVQKEILNRLIVK